MRAAHYSGAGPAAEVITIADVERPTPGPGEVLIEVAAAGLNPVDVKIRAAAFDFGPIEYSDRPGWDVAGTISELGENVSGWAVGDRVFALARFPVAAHTLAEFVAVPASDLALVPPSWSFAEAGAAPLAVLTAWQALDAAGIAAGPATTLPEQAAPGHTSPGQASPGQTSPGQTPRVLVLGGAGGVGHFAVQLAKARGAHVIATASPNKQALVTEWGADEVIDYRDQPALDALAPVDAIIVTVTETLPPRGAVRPGTAVITITGFSDEQTAQLKDWGVGTLERIMVRANGPQLSEVAGLGVSGAVRVNVDSQFPLEELAAAQERVETGRVTGKVVVTIL